MTDTPPPHWGPPSDQDSTREKKPKKHRKIFLWIFLAVQALFLIWIITAVASAGEDSSCEGLTGEALELCRDAGDAGTAIGVGLVIAFWAAVDIILGISYGIYRLSRRPRP